MNWRLSMLDRYRLVSSSDAHSPGKLGREATTFDCPVDYFANAKPWRRSGLRLKSTPKICARSWMTFAATGRLAFA
jgi:PHP family Zn ribbon phosphoesterase